MQLSDFEAMIMRSKTTSPGPDGVSYTAWRQVPVQARRAPFLVYCRWLERGEVPAEFNWAFLALLPKVDEAALAAGDTRPLSLANCDAKLLATALKERLSPLVDAALCRRLFGFRPSASILTPVLEVDAAMQRGERCSATSLLPFLRCRTSSSAPCWRRASSRSLSRRPSWPCTPIISIGFLGKLTQTAPSQCAVGSIRAALLAPLCSRFALLPSCRCSPRC